MADRAGGALPGVAARAATVIPGWAPAALVVLAVPLMRPNFLGESLSPVGFLLVCLALACALVRSVDPDADSRIATLPGPSGALLIACLALGYLWILLRAALVDPGPHTRATIQALFLTVGTIAAMAVLCRDPRIRIGIGRGFVGLIAVCCASYAVTALIWTVGGIGTAELLSIPLAGNEPQPVYVPFTTTAATQSAFGISLPRFTGIGREPGWMAMYCAIAFFMAEMVGFSRRWLKPLLVLGLLGCVSTAGFGVFVVIWAYHRFLRSRGEISLRSYGRQVGGLGVMLVAVWAAFEAPVLGFSAKATQNAVSLDDRQLATEAGIRALLTDPWGGRPTETQGGINLISDIAVAGLPFVGLVIAGLLLSSVRWPGSARFTNAIALIVLATMLTSQPARDSTWAFALVVLATTLGRTDTGPAAGDGGRPDDRATPTSGTRDDTIPNRTVAERSGNLT